MKRQAVDKLLHQHNMLSIYTAFQVKIQVKKVGINIIATSTAMTQPKCALYYGYPNFH